MTKNSHNYGIDMLRIASMLGVVLIHVLGHGGLLKSARSFSEFSTLYFFQTLVQCAVDCFVLISGFVGYREEKYYPRLKNIISLFFVVLFYSVTLSALCKLLDPASVSALDMLKACIPVISQQYWFFTTYLGLFIISPLLNVIIHHADKKQLLIFFIVFTFCSCLSLLKDPFSFKSGYSVIWFIFLYLLGGLIKKHNIANLFSKTTWFLIVLSALILTWTSKIVFAHVDIPIVRDHSNLFLSNTSPSVVVMACGWLCLFSRVSCKTSMYPIINFFSVSAFSVYLIHDNNHVRKMLISKVSDVISGYPIIIMILFITGIVFSIFISCILIDKLRILLFRLARIHKISEHIELFVKKSIDMAYRKLNF